MRITASILAMAPLSMLMGCGLLESETFKECVARQGEYDETIPQGENPRVQFVYDVSDVEDLLLQVRDIEGLTLTFAQGSSDIALQAFTQNNRETGPALLGAGDVSLFRTAPITLPREEVPENACQLPFEGAKLVHTVWHLTPAPIEEE